MASDNELPPRLDYRDKVILAPMVRIGTMPMRLLCLDYGADIVYTEELVDISLVTCRRFENRVMGTVDFAESEEAVPVLRIHPEREKGKLVLQIGTADPERAATVARLVEKDVAGIDVNMGCPKAFSIHAGMGAALLRKPELIRAILTRLVGAVSIPVTCKIRILPDEEATRSLVALIASTGVAAIGVHGRTETQRSSAANDDAAIARLKDGLGIPLIANGGSNRIKSLADVGAFKAATSADSVMVARAAMRNPSLFRKEGLLPMDTVIADYLRIAMEFDGLENNVKYTLQRMLRGAQTLTENGRALTEAVTMKQICEVYGLGEAYVDVSQRLRDRKARETRSPKAGGDGPAEPPAFDVEGLVEKRLRIPRKKLENTKTGSPRGALNLYCVSHSLKLPKYQMTRRAADNKFRALCTLDGKHYSSTYWEKNKNFAESATALVVLDHLNLRELVDALFWDENVDT